MSLSDAQYEAHVKGRYIVTGQHQIPLAVNGDVVINNPEQLDTATWQTPLAGNEGGPASAAQRGVVDPSHTPKCCYNEQCAFHRVVEQNKRERMRCGN